MNEAKDRIKGGIDAAASQAKQATDTAAAGGHNVVDRVKDTAQHVYDRAGEVAGQAKDAVRGFVSNEADAVKHAGEKAQAWAGDAYDVTADALGDVGRDVTALVRKHPLPALAIGFGLGLLLGRVGRIV